jgi:hypothetical protein
MEVSGQLHALATLHPMKEPQVQTRQKDVSAPQSVWTLWQKIFYRCWELKPNSLVIQPIASYYTKWAILALNRNMLHTEMFYNREIPTCPHSIHHRGWVDPRAGLDAMEKRKNLLPLTDLTIPLYIPPLLMQVFHLHTITMNGANPIPADTMKHQLF